MKPFINHSISIRNSYTCQDFLRRRPRRTPNFKFSRIRVSEDISQTDERRVQLKFLQALKIVKPVTKVDLGMLEVTDSLSWRTTLISAFKMISHLKTLSLMRSQEKYLKPLVRLQHLVCRLDAFRFPLHGRRFRGMLPRDPLKSLTQNPLKLLKYCPRIRSLEVLGCRVDVQFSKISIGLTRSLQFLESLNLNTKQWEHLPIEDCKKLRCIYFDYSGIESQNMFSQTISVISRLQNLQEISLKIRFSAGYDIVEAFKKIAQNGILKKINLWFHREMPSNLSKILKALKNCKLISFSLKTFITLAQILKSISEFIRVMDQLESLELYILKDNLFSQTDHFVEICRQISKLQALRSLKLNFHTGEEALKSKRISNFIPDLSGLFKKSIKIETLHLECNQLDSSEALQSVMLLLKNSSNFVTHLKINFGAWTNAKKSNRLILKLMLNLSNIQVLEFPSLKFNASNSRLLDDIVDALYGLKYLREFVIGDFKKAVPVQTLFRTIEAISSKRGLRRFSFGLSHGDLHDLRKKAEKISMKRIIESNPYIESLDLCDSLSNMILTLKIYQWKDK